MSDCAPTDCAPQDCAPIADGALARTKTTAERARAASHKARKALLSPAGLRGAAIEAAWLATHVAMYPMGVVEQRYNDEVDRHNLADLPPVQRGLIIGDVEAAGTPIIMVHGVIDNHSVFTVLRRGLARRGFGRVMTLSYSPWSGDVPRIAKRLAMLVESVCRETGYERVHIVGHSLGGVVARYYVQKMGGDNRVDTLVTLGSPHGGTVGAKFFPHTVSRHMRPNSKLIQDLDAPAPGCRTRFIAIWSDLDQIIMPKRNARIVHPDLTARNVFIRGVGHMSLPVDGRVVHEICTALSHLDQDGSTLAAGAISIGSQPGHRVPKQQPAKVTTPESTAPKAKSGRAVSSSR